MIMLPLLWAQSFILFLEINFKDCFLKFPVLSWFPARSLTDCKDAVWCERTRLQPHQELLGWTGSETVSQPLSSNVSVQPQWCFTEWRGTFPHKNSQNLVESFPWMNVEVEGPTPNVYAFGNLLAWMSGVWLPLSLYCLHNQYYR